VGGSCSTHGRDDNAYKISVGISVRKRQSENLCLNGRMILKWILGK
jgi:hypothetical protein